MRPLAVYAKFDLALTRASGCYLYDDKGRTILDFYSGHGVISIGHSHPHFVTRMKAQMDRLLYYSNAVDFEEQYELCRVLGDVSGCSDYDLFMANSGAEAVENALKVASYITGRKKMVVMLNGFHGRTSLAAQCTEASKICAPINSGLNVVMIPLGDTAAAEAAIDDQTAAVMIEGIQGVGGIHEAPSLFWQSLRELTHQHGALLIADEIQSGYGRSGKFFTFQHHGVSPDVICTAKGMGNGYPVSATWVKQGLPMAQGSLGTTFGGNPLACAAATAVAEVIRDENLIEHAAVMGEFLQKGLASLPGLSNIRGRGLMIGFDLDHDSYALRSKLLHQHQIITGSSRLKETVRILPPLAVSRSQCEHFLEQLALALRSPQ
ncbi:MAG TPA: aminotransferase class III-fold pyridoxal phosphate-dependent enzyme [Oligoflexus sp.]|uniref:aspartate aminotransferase family protein n=1 Tax=Oligoflexus sp. TaxID=1971216 RepID=UPI002D2CBD16|nr:aminotransferase class III-fold pyridoxal phosphate-dependent enzyme [Oligoflexus sp.]HYX36426.1 aminotransferase class III-fold pyridoxal phosphate-dependent enzyme [Oligoflexus sp.]